VKTTNKEFILSNQHVESIEEIQNLIESMTELNPFIMKSTTFLEDDREVLNQQYITSAQKSGTLNIILSGSVDTGSGEHR
jgi:hypothetical protein